ncbi:MAG TPA: 5'(3')-deoxyribonucleotidase [Chitinophagaceae bacterium]|nr:5'(3')-deoxyribonucleotidase [Chitinophagaceae bacterium]
MRILIDMDEVMADAVARFLEWYERDFGIRYTTDDIAGTKLHNIVPAEHRPIVTGYPHRKGFFEGLPVIASSYEVIKKLYERHEVFIVSAAMEFRYSLSEKYDWLDEHFPFIHWKRRVFCGDKSVIQGDVLIDDHDFNLLTFSGRKILFSSPHNIHDTRFERMNSWLEAVDIFHL